MKWPSFKKKTLESDKTNESVYNNPLYFEGIGNFKPSYVKLTGDNKIQNDLLLCEYFNTLSEASAPIRKYSDQINNINLYYLDKKGNAIETDSPTIKAINEFWQNSGELFFIYDLLLGNSYIQGLESGTVETKGEKVLTQLYLLPSEFTSIELNSTPQDFRDIKIKEYFVNLNGNYKDLHLTDIEKVLHIKTPSTFSYTQNDLYGLSRLTACEKNIQSIASGYGARIALYDNGPRVIITGKSQGEFASMGESEDVKDVQKRVNNTYGRTNGQFQIMITDVPLDVSTISLNAKELMINENNGADFRRICNAYNQDSKIHGDPESTTYDNVTTALSDFYNSSLKSLVNNRLERINEFVAQWDDNLVIKADYSSIKEIAEFESTNEEKVFEKAAKGLITRNEYLEDIGSAKVALPEFDQYYVYASDEKWYPVTQINTDGQE